MTLKFPTLIMAALMVSISAGPSFSAEKKRPDSKVNYSAFVSLSSEAGKFRKKRLVNLERFLKMSHAKNTLILDTRSEKAYLKKHIKGAVHLNFSDFTTGKLKKVIPSKNTRILIYCNNNIANDPVNFAAKSQPLALNIPTFINLYGYGYKNIYELSSLVSANDKALRFEGSDVK